MQTSPDESPLECAKASWIKGILDVSGKIPTEKIQGAPNLYQDQE